MPEAPTQKETAREFRVAKQTLAMHADLRDHYARLGLGMEVFLLVFAAVASTTTFAADDLYTLLGVGPAKGRLSMGIASTVAFSCSLVLLLIDPRAKAAVHAEAAKKWSEVVLLFRRYRKDDDNWPSETLAKLSDAYSLACEVCTEIPDRKFNRLKSKYLRKVEVSRLKDKYPGCPVIVLSILCQLRDTYAALKHLLFRRTTKGIAAQSSSSSLDKSSDKDLSNRL